MIRLIYKILNKITKLRLSFNSGISIGPNSQVNYRGLYLRHGCSFNTGSGCMIEGQIHFERPNAKVTIGSNSFMGRSAIAVAECVDIGDNVLIAWGCHIVDHNSHSVDWKQRLGDTKNWLIGEKTWDYVKIAPIKICDNAWIGFNSIILKGVTIGEGAIVAAGSVVTKDVSPFTVVAGNPAKLIRKLCDSDPMANFESGDTAIGTTVD